MLNFQIILYKINILMIYVASSVNPKHSTDKKFVAQTFKCEVLGALFYRLPESQSLWKIVYRLQSKLK